MSTIGSILAVLEWVPVYTLRLDALGTHDPLLSCGGQTGRPHLPQDGSSVTDMTQSHLRHTWFWSGVFCGMMRLGTTVVGRGSEHSEWDLQGLT